MEAVEERAERADAQRNRRNVLETADRMFAERGTQVTLGEIAAAAGVGAGTVYRHFPAKEALLATVLDLRLSQIAEFGAEAMLVADPEAAFFSYLRFITDSAFDNRVICEALAVESDWVRPDKSEGKCVIDTPLGRLLDRAQRAGAVRPDLDVEDIRVLLAGVVAMAGSVDGPERGRRLSAMVWEGLRLERNSEVRNESTAASESRDETSVTEPRCPVCGGVIETAGTGRPPKYCSAACRQKAFRDKRRAAT